MLRAALNQALTWGLSRAIWQPLRGHSNCATRLTAVSALALAIGLREGDALRLR